MGPYSQQIAPLILMVFVENAFKHSAEQAKNIVINILLVLTKNELYFEWINNLEEISENNIVNSGIGLVNVKKRLDFLYPKTSDLNIEQVDFQYHVKLSMRLSTMP
jgi:two-component system LytT family sensor kinase